MRPIGRTCIELLDGRIAAKHEEVGLMLQLKGRSAVLAATLAVLVIAAIGPKAAAQTHTAQSSALYSDELAQIKIARALSAAPPDVAKAATVAEMDAHGTMTVSRPGTNGFTCMPGEPKGVGQPAMCADEASMQWFKDFAEHKPKPTNTVPGITYMLAGATQRGDSDPNDTTSPPIAIGPHWMIMWPFDPKTTGLPTTHRPTGAYIMWAGSPYAHVHIMGRP
jgi:hypothetical protein